MSTTDSNSSVVNPQSSLSASSVQVVALGGMDNVDALTEQMQPRVLARQVPSSTARGVLAAGGQKVVIDSTNERITISDSVQQIFLGKLPDGSFGLVISKPGVDVSTLFT